MSINEAGIITTYKCNSRCLMCKIWQRSDPYELEAGYFNNLPPQLKIIGLTGGEPFLREDIAEVYRIIRKRCPRAKITLGSNGLAPGLIKQRMQEILSCDKKAGIIISLDGIAETHDRVRGVAGAFTMAMRTIEEVKRVGVRSIGLNFTILNENLSQMRDVHRLSRKLKLKISYVLAHNSELYYKAGNRPLENPQLLREQLDYIIGREMAGLNIKNWLKSYYLAGIYDFAKYGKRRCACIAGNSSVFIDFNGDIYPCLSLDKKIGSLKSPDLKETKPPYRPGLDKSCPNLCWLGCSVYPLLRSKPYLAFFWLTAAKLKSISGVKSYA